jgi:glucose-6-phosphate isomerase, archaeal
MRGYYKDEGALKRSIDQGGPVHYEVLEKHNPEQYGRLLLCISKLYPVRASA